VAQFKFLSQQFLEAMDELGEYGFTKHGENSSQAKILKGDLSRSYPRHQTKQIMEHARDHTHQYEGGIYHDYFGDLIHQLAAVAYNAMMEAQMAGLVDSDIPQATAENSD
jgi:hypothetical protein